MDLQSLDLIPNNEHKAITKFYRVSLEQKIHPKCNVPKSDMHANPKSDMQTLKVTCMTTKHYSMMHALN